MSTCTPGYLYVLTHPSDSQLNKVGQTTRDPKLRLEEHNTQFEKYAGQVVQATGQNWELRTYISVPDPYWAETVFWASTPFADIPYRGGIEIERMDWSVVERALEAASHAGVRPRSSVPEHVYAYCAWMKKRLHGRGITLVGQVRSKNGRSEFKCERGHEWRTMPLKVAQGEGCPECGIGTRAPEEILKAIDVGTMFLLTNEKKPESIRFGLTLHTDGPYEQPDWGDWFAHRYRNVEEPRLAKILAMQLMGASNQEFGSEIEISLAHAEERFKGLHHELQSRIALVEIAREGVLT